MKELKDVHRKGILDVLFLTQEENAGYAIKELRREFSISLTDAKFLWHVGDRARKLEIRGTIPLEAFVEGMIIARDLRRKDKLVMRGFYAGMM